MNIKAWSQKKKIIAILGIVLVIVGIAATIFLVQRRQNTQTKAEKSTNLTLTPANQPVQKDGEASLDINIDPGKNQVSSIKITLKFDANKFVMTEDDFALEESGSSLTIVNGPIIGEGTFSILLGTGSDPTKVIRAPQKLGTIKLSVKPTAATGNSEVSFDYAQTEVRSIGSDDAFNENVLSSATPATITIEAVCRPNISTCSWDPLDGADTYRYKITNVTDNKVFSEGTTTETSIDFTSIPGKEYKCEVNAENSCGGKGEAESTSNTCALPSQSPTPTPSGVISSTPTPTPTPTNGPSSTPTPSRSTSSTPTPTSGLTSTPTPTTPQGGVESPTPTTPGEFTPVPSLPPTGSPVVFGGIIGAVLIIVGGIALLFL